MANDSGSVKTKARTKKKRGGWVEVEEIPKPQTKVSTPIIAGVSASEVPKSAFSITLNEVIAKYDEILGAYRWRQLSEGMELSPEEKTKLLEAVLGSAPNASSVQTLFEALHKPDALGWTIAGSCPDIARISQEFLNKKGVSVEPPQLDAETQRLLDVLNHREPTGVPQ